MDGKSEERSSQEGGSVEDQKEEKRSVAEGAQEQTSQSMPDTPMQPVPPTQLASGESGPSDPTGASGEIGASGAGARGKESAGMGGATSAGAPTRDAARPGVAKGQPMGQSMRQAQNEFRWSVFHQRLLNDLLAAIEADVLLWKKYLCVHSITSFYGVYTSFFHFLRLLDSLDPILN